MTVSAVPEDVSTSHSEEVGREEVVARVEDLRVSVESEDGRVEVVKGVSFDIRAGETVGLVGESGSGKTMTALGLVDLLPRAARVDSGQVWLGDLAVSELDPVRRRRVLSRQVGVVFQNPLSSLNPRLTIATQVVEAVPRSIGSTAARRARAAELLERVGIAQVSKTLAAFPHELSGGLNQRVVIALALARDPALLVADEPTTALDVSVQAQVLDLLDQLKEELSLGVLLVSHDMGVIADRTRRVHVMAHGVVVESGPTQQVLVDPREPYTQRLLSATPARLIRARPTAAVSQQVQANTDLSPLVRVDELSREFPVVQPGKFRRGRHRALDRVSLDIHAGQAIGIVGESGSGKTTLARNIVGLDHPDAGSILFEGRDITQLDKDRRRHWRRRVQYIFQDPYGSLDPGLTVAQSIAEPLRHNGVDLGNVSVAERVQTLLEEVELPASFASRFPGELSGGQRQRVGIARTLANDPDLVVADEPVSALDLSVQARVLSLLERLRRERGLTLVLISHDLAVVRYLCESVYVLRNGSIVEHGLTEQLYTSPTHPYTRTLLDAIPGRALEYPSGLVL